MEELLEGMSDAEFFYWMAFSALEPFGDDRADWHSAMSLAQQANMNRKKGKSAYKPEKFLLKFKSAVQGQNMNQMKAAMMAQYYALGGGRTN